MSTPPVPAKESRESSSVVLHVCAWLGFPVYGALFVLAAVSAAGAPGANHSASAWNSIAWLWPIGGTVVSGVAIVKSRSWPGRFSGAVPLVGYLAVIAYLVSWKLAH